MKEKVLVINPGSTSTKIALFAGDELVFKQTICHDVEVLKQFSNAIDQLDYRKETILRALKAAQIDISDCAAFSGRGGGLNACQGGVYEINDAILKDARSGKYADHPACLGNLLAYDFAKTYHARAFTVNPPSTDEFRTVARVTGLKNVTRFSNTHALNQKETAMRVARDLGLAYDQANFIVAHLGGGVSIGAHDHGRIVDCNDNIKGDGPMAPTRIGSLPARDLIDMCYSGRWSHEEMLLYLSKTGGFVDHLGTSEMLEVARRICEGDAYAKLIYDAFKYQVGKQIGAMAAVLHGKIDAIVLTGGIANDKELVKDVTEMVGFLAPVVVRAGEFEMEALASGALRVLHGEEQPQTYNGAPVFSGFGYLKKNACGQK